MADFGGYFRADDGTLAVTSDTPCYEFHKEHPALTRIGNVNTYSVDTQVYPLILVACGVGGKAGVLSIQGSAGNWSVSVLANKVCTILSFVPISGNTSTGYGIATYDSTGRLVFDSFKKILNVKRINSLAENMSFQSGTVVDIVGYTSGPVKPSKSVSEQWLNVDSYGYADNQYQCTYQIQYNCYPEQVYNCTNSWVCTPSFSCDYDFVSGGYSCGYVDSCGYQTTCGYSTETVCRTENVQVCGWVTIINYASIDALVRTTNWSIERGVASVASGGSITFDWLLHKSGYYKQIVQWVTTAYSHQLGANGLPPGYIFPFLFLSANEAFEGELTKNNTFPYTSDRANIGALTCITALRSDYD